MITPQITSAVLDDWKIWIDDAEKLRASETIPLASFVYSLEKAAESANKSHLGWLIGSSSDYLSRGVLGRVVMGAKTIGIGLHWLCRYQSLIQDATNVKLEITDGVARLSYNILDPDIWPREQDSLYTLGIFANFLRVASIDVMSHVKVNLQSPKQQKNSELQKYFHAPITYSALVNEITFPAKFLSNPLARETTFSQNDITELTQIFNKKNRCMSFYERTKYAIYAALLESNISQEFVAKEIGLSPRTLRRKLLKESISYQDLLDDCRMGIASRELSLSKYISLSQLAFSLGYSEHSTFSRAFSSWFGVSPRIYRKTITGMNDIN